MYCIFYGLNYIKNKKTVCIFINIISVCKHSNSVSFSVQIKIGIEIEILISIFPHLYKERGRLDTKGNYTKC